MERSAMKIAIIIALLSLCSMACSAEIIPVNKWPKSINLENKQIVNPSVKECVQAGYRLLPANKPTTPPGKKIAAEKIIQDPNDTTRCKYDVTYQDIPSPTSTPDDGAWVGSDVLWFRCSTNNGALLDARLKSFQTNTTPEAGK